MAKRKKSSRQPVQAPTTRRKVPSRSLLIGAVVVAALIAIGAVAAFLLRGGNEPNGTAMQTEAAALSADGTILEVYAGELRAGKLEEKIEEYFAV